MSEKRSRNPGNGRACVKNKASRGCFPYLLYKTSCMIPIRADMKRANVSRDMPTIHHTKSIKVNGLPSDLSFPNSLPEAIVQMLIPALIAKTEIYLIDV